MSEHRVHLVDGPADGHTLVIDGDWLALSPAKHPDDVYEITMARTPEGSQVFKHRGQFPDRGTGLRARVPPYD
jgi:hypothetical protein